MDGRGTPHSAVTHHILAIDAYGSVEGAVDVKISGIVRADPRLRALARHQSTDCEECAEHCATTKSDRGHGLQAGRDVDNRSARGDIRRVHLALRVFNFVKDDQFAITAVVWVGESEGGDRLCEGATTLRGR